MTGQRLGKCIVLCLLPWSCLSFAWSDAAGPGTASLGAGHVRKGLSRDAANGTDVQSNMSAPCTALPPPRYGYYYVDRGSGVSLGSVLVYWCQEGYQLVGSERLACLRQDSTSSWSHPPPQCQAAPQPSGTGSRIAVAASLLSGAVILALSVSFAVCCWRDRARKSRGGQQQQRRKVRGRRRDPSTAERGRNAFGRLKHYHRRDYHLSAVSSSVFPGAFAGCNNLAFQSSPSQQPKVPLERWRCEAQALLQPVLPAGPAPGSGPPGHLPAARGPPGLLPAARGPPGHLPAARGPPGHLPAARGPPGLLPAARGPPGHLPAARGPPGHLPAARGPPGHLPAARGPPGLLPAARGPAATQALQQVWNAGLRI